MGHIINIHDNTTYGYISMAEVTKADKTKAAEGDTHAEVHTNNTIKVTKEQLSEEQKQQLARAVENFEDECLMTFSMLSRGGKVIQKENFPMPHRITITEDIVKFQEMFNMAMHHALINQSGIMSNSVQNAIYRMMKGNWTPGYITPNQSHRPPQQAEKWHRL